MRCPSLIGLRHQGVPPLGLVRPFVLCPGNDESIVFSILQQLCRHLRITVFSCTHPGTSFSRLTEEIACRSGLALRSCLRTKSESETIIADLGWYIRRSDDTRTRLGRLGVLAPITWQPLSEMIPSLPKISIAGNAKRSMSPSESDFIPDSKSLTGVTECSKSPGSYDSKCVEICEDTRQEGESRVPTSICFSIASTSRGGHALCPF